jgi:hypothetical protein
MEMHVVTLENHSQYNFTMTLERQLEFLKDQEKYSEMTELLTSHLNMVIHTIKYFGDNKMAQKILKGFYELVEYQCLPPYHKCRGYYSLHKEVWNEVRSSYPSETYCIELMERSIKLVSIQYGL